MSFLPWNEETSGRASHDTDAFLTKLISGELRKDKAEKRDLGYMDTRISGSRPVISDKQEKQRLSGNTPLSVWSLGLSSLDIETRLRAVSALAEATIEGDQEAVFDLQKALYNDAEDVRVAAVEALGSLGERTPVILLLLALLDPFWDVRAAAAQVLGNLGERIPINHLTAHLRREPDMSVRETIVRALGRQGNAMPAKVLIQVLQKDESWLVREAAAWALGQLGEQAPLHALVYALRCDPDENVRAAAAKALGQSGAQEAMVPLFKALEDDNEDTDVWDAAALALQQFDEEVCEMKYQEDSYRLDDPDLHWLFSDHSLLAEKEWQTFFAIMQFISDKKGGVHNADLLDTKQGRVLLIDCFYQRTEDSLWKTLLPSIEGTSLVEPIEVALNGRDDVVQSVIQQALEIKYKREWLDLLVVSFALSSEDVNQERLPLRIVVVGMGCQKVREKDTSVLDQIVDRWIHVVQEPLVCERTPDLAGLKVWYQSNPVYAA